MSTQSAAEIARRDEAVWGCKTCAHPDLDKINEAILTGTPLRNISGTFHLGVSALSRHKTNHLSSTALMNILDGTPEPAAEGSGPGRRFKVVEVHAKLAALATVLEKVVRENARSPRRAVSIAHIAREHRATLEAIARLQSDDRLQRAAAVELVEADLAALAGRLAEESFLGPLVADLVLAGLDEVMLRQLLGARIGALLEPDRHGEPAAIAAWRGWATEHARQADRLAEQHEAALDDLRDAYETKIDEIKAAHLADLARPRLEPVQRRAIAAPPPVEDEVAEAEVIEEPGRRVGQPWGNAYRVAR